MIKTIKSDNIKILKLLLNYGAEINLDNYDQKNAFGYSNTTMKNFITQYLNKIKDDLRYIFYGKYFIHILFGYNYF